MILDKFVEASIELERDIVDDIRKNVNKFIEKTKVCQKDSTIVTSKSTPLLISLNDELKEKHFSERPSMLTEMLEVNHIKTIYNIFAALLIVFCLNTIVFDLIEGGKDVWDFQLITYSLGQFPHVIVLWCCMMLFTVLILFPAFRCWALLYLKYLNRQEGLYLDDQNIIEMKHNNSSIGDTNDGGMRFRPSPNRISPDDSFSPTSDRSFLDWEGRYQDIKDTSEDTSSSASHISKDYQHLDSPELLNVSKDEKTFVDKSNKNTTKLIHKSHNSKIKKTNNSTEKDKHVKSSKKSFNLMIPSLPTTTFNAQTFMCILCILLYALYQAAFLVIPIYWIIKVYDLPPASSFLIMLEQMRILMKVHSFIRENVAKINHGTVVLNEGEFEKIERKHPTPEDLIPNFSKYLYFLFAPTLVYRDSYPRTTTVHWDYVVSNLGQVVTCLFFTYYIFIRFCIPVFQHFNQDHLSPKTILLSVFGSMLPGTLVLLIAFFGVLHSWLNAFAEMLRFGDRMFYKDWWNSTSFNHFYRTWNIVVHDWLYLYIYKDIRMFFGRVMSRPLAMLIVFQISALAHELVIAVSFRYFYPVLLVLFGIIGFGAMFLNNKRHQNFRAHNILLWVMMFIGNGLLWTLYSVEWYARKNCKKHIESPIVDLFVPRSWYCRH